LVEFSRCTQLIKKYTIWNSIPENLYTITVVFYEGNDLDDTLKEKNHSWNPVEFQVRHGLPLFQFVYKQTQSLFQQVINKKNTESIGMVAQINSAYPVTTSNLTINTYPQAAAMELSPTELLESLQLLERSLIDIKTRLPHASNYQFLFVPSVATTYPFDSDSINVKSYKGERYVPVNPKHIQERHRVIVSNIKAITQNQSWQFCNTTPKLRALTTAGQIVHGPNDFQHLNKAGYKALAEHYEHCFTL
jgi:hypothetical protein